MALAARGVTLDAVNRIFEVETSAAGHIGDFTIEITASESINSVSETATFSLSIYEALLLAPTSGNTI